MPWVQLDIRHDQRDISHIMCLQLFSYIFLIYVHQTSRYKTEADAPSEAKDKDRNVKALCYSSFFDKPFEFSHGIACSAESYAEYDGEAKEGEYSYFYAFICEALFVLCVVYVLCMWH